MDESDMWLKFLANQNNPVLWMNVIEYFTLALIREDFEDLKK